MRLRDRARVAFGQERPGESERLEETLVEDDVERIARQVLDDQAQQHGVGVGVVEALARRKVGLACEAHCQELLRRPGALRCLVDSSGPFRRGGVAEEAAPHAQQLADGDPRAVRYTGMVLRHGIVEPEPAFLDKLQDHCAGHGLGVGTDAVAIVDGDRIVGADPARAEGRRPVALLARLHQHDGGRDSHVLVHCLELRPQPHRIDRLGRGRGWIAGSYAADQR